MSTLISSAPTTLLTLTLPDAPPALSSSFTSTFTVSVAQSSQTAGGIANSLLSIVPIAPSASAGPKSVSEGDDGSTFRTVYVTTTVALATVTETLTMDGVATAMAT